MLEKESFCKVNLLLNILGKRPDGFHELETLMHPVGLHDRLSFDRGGRNIKLTCNDPILPVNARNLVFRAAALFLKRAGIKEGVRIHLEKRIPISAGLGGGSGNAAATFLALNELFGHPVAPETLHRWPPLWVPMSPFSCRTGRRWPLAAARILEPLNFFPALRSAHIVLIHPGFGISTAWAYQQLGRFPEAQNGRTGRAANLAALLRAGDQAGAGREFYNSLEAPALRKYPLLELFQEFLRENGAWAALMSGSGSSTFALVDAKEAAERLRDSFKAKFGGKCWTAVVKAAG